MVMDDTVHYMLEAVPIAGTALLSYLGLYIKSKLDDVAMKQMLNKADLVKNQTDTKEELTSHQAEIKETLVAHIAEDLVQFKHIAENTDEIKEDIKELLRPYRGLDRRGK